MDLLLPMMVAALLTAGMGVALLGSVKVALARRLAIDEARVGGLVSLFGFVMIPVILTAGFLTDRAGGETGAVGKPLILGGGCLLMALSLALLSRARSYGLALTAVLLLSASWAIIINVGNVLTPPAFGDEHRAYAFNLASVFFGLGAFLTPLTIVLLMRRTSFTICLSILAGFCLLPALLALGARDVAVEVAGEDPGLGAVLGHPLLWLCGLGLFFYGPLEASLAAWSTTYLGDHGVSETASANLLSSFWLAYIAGRLLAAFLVPDVYARLLILLLALICIGLLLAFVLCRSRSLAMALVPAAGLVFGPIFPTLISVLFGAIPPPAHGRAVGFFFAIGGIGWTLLPMLIGLYARRAGVQRGFLVAVGAAVGLSAMALLIWLR